MKFFRNIKALTLVELIISITVSAILFTIITVLITDSVNNLQKNDTKSAGVSEMFEFKNDMNKVVRSGYVKAKVFNGTTNNVLYLKNQDSSKGYLLGVVNLDTKKIQKDYIYGDNFLGYRYLSKDEITEIEADNNKIYDKIFLLDKVYKDLRIKDLKINLYNSNEIIDIKFSSIILYNTNLIGENLNDVFIPKEDLIEYNLVF